MTILHCAPYFAPAWAYGGTPRAVYELAKQQAKSGHEVWVVTTDALSDTKRHSCKSEKKDGLTIIRLPNLSNYVSWKLHFSTPNFRHWPHDLPDFDLIHLHETRSLLHLLVLKKVAASKVVLSPWGTLPYNNSKSTIKKLYDMVCLPWLRQRVTMGIGQTTHEVAELKAFKLGQEQAVVPLGCELPPTKVPHTFAKEHNLPSDQKIVLFLGRFSALKGIKLLLESFAVVSRSNMMVHLCLVGRDDGFKVGMLELITKLKLSQRVTIIESIYSHDRFAAYKAATLFVFTPIVFEETSTATLEALTMGVPVLTTVQAEIPFLTYKDGVLIVKATTAAVVKGLKKMLQEPSDVDRRYIKNTFSWSSVARQYTKLYHQS